MFQKTVDLTLPTPARQDAPIGMQGRAHGAKYNERHVCGRARVSESTLSPPDGRTTLEGFQHPDKHPDRC